MQNLPTIRTKLRAVRIAPRAREHTLRTTTTTCCIRRAGMAVTTTTSCGIGTGPTLPRHSLPKILVRNELGYIVHCVESPDCVSFQCFDDRRENESADRNDCAVHSFSTISTISTGGSNPTTDTTGTIGTTCCPINGRGGVEILADAVIFQGSTLTSG